MNEAHTDQTKSGRMKKKKKRTPTSGKKYHRHSPRREHYRLNLAELPFVAGKVRISYVLLIGAMKSPCDSVMIVTIEGFTLNICITIICGVSLELHHCLYPGMS